MGLELTFLFWRPDLSGSADVDDVIAAAVRSASDEVVLTGDGVLRSTLD